MNKCLNCGATTAEEFFCSKCLARMSYADMCVGYRRRVRELIKNAEGHRMSEQKQIKKAIKAFANDMKKIME